MKEEVCAVAEVAEVAEVVAAQETRTSHGANKMEGVVFEFW